MTDDSQDYDSVKRVEELQIGASIRIQCKRGTDVRDDDSVSVDANFETIDDLRDGSEELTTIVTGRMADLRGFNPEDDDQ